MWRYQALTQPGSDLLLLKATQGDDIIAALPFALLTRTAVGVTLWRHAIWIGHDLNPCPGLVSIGAEAGDLWGNVFRWFRTNQPGTWLELHDSSGDLLPEELTTRDEVVVERIPAEPQHVLTLGGRTRGQLQDGFSARLQRSLHRGHRRAAESGELEFRVMSGEWRDGVEHLRVLAGRRFGAGSWLADDRNVALLHDLTEAAPGAVRYFVMLLNGSVVHIILCFLSSRRVHYWLAGMDETRADLAPGLLNLEHAILWSRDQGFEEFDFLRGTESYKREFHPVMSSMYHHIIHTDNRHARFRVATIVRHLRRLIP